jgi:translation initiation factor IF-3
MGLDLVEVADKADPPVCRIMDYGKFKYEQSQRAKESRKKATHVLVKEMKYRPKIGPGDFDTKTRKVEQFLGDGSKVKVTIMFRGREMQHPELGRRILDRVAETVDHVGRVEVFPKQDGRNMIMVLVPGQGTRRQREAAADRREADVAAPPVADPVADPTAPPVADPVADPTAAPVADPATASAAAPIADSTVVPAAAPAADSTVAPAVDPAAVAPTPTEPPTVTSEDTQTETSAGTPTETRE